MVELEMLDTLAARINEEHRASSSCNILHVLDTPASPTRSELSYCVQAQALIMGSVNINLSEHARRRLREKGLTVADVRKTCSPGPWPCPP
jgi:hypothetical protein